MVLLERGGFYDLDDVLRDLVEIQYTRNDFQLNRVTSGYVATSSRCIPLTRIRSTASPSSGTRSRT